MLAQVLMLRIPDRDAFIAACDKIHERSINLHLSPFRRFALYSSGTAPSSSDFGPILLHPLPTETTLLEDERDITNQDLTGSTEDDKATAVIEKLKVFSFPPPIEDGYSSPSRATNPLLPESPKQRPQIQNISTRGSNTERSDLVFRVRGIPGNFSKDETVKLLRKVLDVDSNTRIVIRSLARIEDQRNKIAVVREDQMNKIAVVGINPIPQFLLGKDKKWYSLQEEYPRITIDNHFHGMTILYSPDPSKHKLE